MPSWPTHDAPAAKGLEPVAVVLERFGLDPAEIQAVSRTSLAAALGGAGDPRCILAYLGGLGVQVEGLDDLLRVSELQDEEELAAIAVVEGVLISVASDGVFILYEP